MNPLLKRLLFGLIFVFIISFWTYLVIKNESKPNSRTEKTEIEKIADKNWQKAHNQFEQNLKTMNWEGKSINLLKQIYDEPQTEKWKEFGNAPGWQWCWKNPEPKCYYDFNDDALIDLVL